MHEIWATRVFPFSKKHASQGLTVLISIILGELPSILFQSTTNTCTLRGAGPCRGVIIWRKCENFRKCYLAIHPKMNEWLFFCSLFNWILMIFYYTFKLNVGNLILTKWSNTIALPIFDIYFLFEIWNKIEVAFSVVFYEFIFQLPFFQKPSFRTFNLVI